MSARISSPRPRVVANLSSSRSSSSNTFAARLLSSGSHASPISIAIAAIAGVNASVPSGAATPRRRPHRTTRRIRRRTTYPLPTLEGYTPSEMRYDTARTWSPITLSLSFSASLALAYVMPAIDAALSMMGRIRSVS